MFRDSSAASIAVFAVILAGCSNVGAPGLGAVPLAPAAPSTADTMPLQYSVEITNSLRDPLTFTLTPGEHATLHGPSTFELQPHTAKTVGLTIPAFAPGQIVGIEGSNTSHSETLRETLFDAVQCDASALNCVAVGMHGLTRMDDTSMSWHSRDAGFTWTVSTLPPMPLPPPARQTLPRGFSALPATEYSVKLNNDLSEEALKVSIKTSSDSILSGPASFLLDPTEGRTVKLSGPDRLGFIDFVRIVDNATGQVTAKLALIKEKRDNISIGDMFEMQMMMNHLSQLSEMSTSILSSSHTARVSMARNVKG